jgi:hypothetical protein
MVGEEADRVGVVVEGTSDCSPLKRIKLSEVGPPPNIPIRSGPHTSTFS